MRQLINKAPTLAAAALALVAVTGPVLAACGPTGSAAGSGAPASSAPTTTPTTTGTGGMVPGGGGAGGVVPTMPTNPTGGPTVPPSAIAGLARIMVPTNQVDLSGVKGPIPSDVQTAGGRYVVFSVAQTGCQRVIPQVGEQSGNRVVIILTVVNTGTAGQMCPMIAREVQEILELAAPLGNRILAFQTLVRLAG